jgi:hypothetical protein
MNLVKTKAAAAGLVLAAGSVLGLVAAPTASAAPGCAGCEGARFTGDGVRIHSCASTSCTTLGLGYRSHTLRVICIIPITKNGFVHVDDLSTGVVGWASDQYVDWACD